MLIQMNMGFLQKFRNRLDWLFAEDVPVVSLKSQSLTLLMTELLRYKHNVRNIGMTSKLELNQMTVELYKKELVEQEESLCSLNDQLIASQAECAFLSTRVGVIEEKLDVSQKNAAPRSLEDLVKANTDRHLIETGRLRHQLVSAPGESSSTQDSLTHTAEISKLKAQLADMAHNQSETEDELNVAPPPVDHPSDLDSIATILLCVTDDLFPVDPPKCFLPADAGYFEALAPQTTHCTQTDDVRTEGEVVKKPEVLESLTLRLFRVKPRGGMAFRVGPPHYPRRFRVRNGKIVGIDDPTPKNHGLAMGSETSEVDLIQAGPQ